MNFKTVLLSLGAFTAMSPVALAEDPVFDMGVEVALTSDYMDTGLTNSDHDPSGSITLSPSYGIFYGEIYAATIDYGAPEPKIESKFAIGATPEFGNLAVDLNLARRIKFDDPSADRWLPYLTATYTVNDSFNASFGTGYYLYDDSDTADFWELYLGFTATHASGASLTGEYYWEPDSDGANNQYYELIGTASMPFMEKWEAVGKIGYEGYEDKLNLASYVWYEARINYSVNDHIVVSAAYHGNDMSTAECATQAYTDCGDAVFATLTLKGNLSDTQK